MPKFTENAHQSGYTDYYEVDFNDLTNTTDDASQTFTYAVKAGQEVRNVAVKLITAFDDSGGGDELDITIGSTDVDGYITAASSPIHTDQTEITYIQDTGAYVIGGSGARGFLYTADDTIDIVFTPNRATGQSYSLSECTAGKVRILFNIADTNF